MLRAEPHAAPPRARLVPRRCSARSRATRRCSCSCRSPTPTKDSPNENYARELMELFTLGKGYTERDIREAARALTGFASDWNDNGLVAIDYDAERARRRRQADPRQRGRFGVDDVLDLVCAHPRTPRSSSTKLWSFFVATPPSRATAARARRASTALGPEDQAGRARRSSSTRRSTATSTRPTWSSARSSTSPARCARPARTITHGYPTGCSTRWASSRSARRRVAGWDWGPAWMSSNSMRQRFAFGNFAHRRRAARRCRGGQRTARRSRPSEAYELALQRRRPADGSPRTRDAS